MRILIVEDEVITSLSMKLELESYGFEICDTVTRGEYAVESAKQKLPDIIIMDIHLAGSMSGLEAAEKILSFHSCKFIFISGYNLEEVQEELSAVVPMAVFKKPVSIKKVKHLIEEDI